MNLDFINQLDGLVAAIRYGGTHRFTFSTETGWLFYRAEVLLRKYHIPIYGREIVSDGEQAFQVRQRQAKWAEYILCSAGCPLTSPLLDPRNDLPSGKTRPLPKPWTVGSGPTTGIGRIMDFMDSILPGKRVGK